ncbi:MAG: hypothetical protein KGI25_07560 [Thaumarchaeota archaeon]|nr:hypothetical protein [Nitrososphaerota archaeon]
MNLNTMQNGYCRLKKFFKLSLFSILLVSVVFSSLPHNAFGDGFAMENLPPASVGNRQVQLFVKLNPTILFSNSGVQPTVFFRWFDASTNQTLQHISFFLTITKHNQLLFRELLHTHTGILNINIIPTSGPSWTVYGDHEPILNGWVPDNDDDPIDVQGPIFNEGGLYHFNIQMFSIDYDNNIFDTTDNPQSVPNFDAYLSVGDVSNHDLTYSGNTYNSTVISYYDKINDDFNFDPSKLQLSYSMPFDWNMTRLANQPIFVHEEIHIPKAFKEFTNTPTYTATMNGYEITGRRLIVDPYTSGTDVIAHILLNKIDIQQIAKSMPNGTDSMNFTLAPAKSNVQTSNSALTDFGGWGVKLGWNPTQITANTANKLNLSFFDAFTENPVNGDVNYNLKMLDSSGNTIFSKTGLTAKNSQDTQTLNLPGNGIYTLQLNITSVVGPTGLADTSRIGMARANLVIPSTVTADTGVVALGNQAGGQSTQPPSTTTTSTTTTTTTANNTSGQIVIPVWVKNNAKWWSQNTIDDSTFASGIQYLIKQGIIQIPTTQQGQAASPGVQIPQWVKTNAGWWSSGQIDDQTFVAGIQYLIKIGIITV